MIGVYDSSYRWPKGSPRESGANEQGEASGAGEFAALADGLVADVFTKSYPPHLAFAKK